MSGAWETQLRYLVNSYPEMQSQFAGVYKEHLPVRS